MNSEQLLIQGQRANLKSYTERIHKRMERFPYAYWVTYDFRRNVDYSEGLKMIDSWIRKRSRIHKAHIDNNTGYEPDFSLKRFSAHSILVSDVELEMEELRSSWKHGDYLKVEPYRVGGGCIEYTFRWHVADLLRTHCPLTGGCKKGRKKKNGERVIRCPHQAGAC